MTHCVDAPHRVTQVRHPNLLEPWTGHVYAQLRDADLRVRKNTLLVLTHLILNDMVKVKGQVSRVALCAVHGVVVPEGVHGARCTAHDAAREAHGVAHGVWRTAHGARRTAL